MSSGYGVHIPNSAKKTIQNIKEITGNHSDEEIYVVLKECNMDPNETVQKLIYQDPFHEVKRKRDKKKENMNNKEPAEPHWRTSIQGRGGRGGGRANYSSRDHSHDTGAGRNSGAGKSSGSSLPVSAETERKEKSLSTSAAAIVANGPTVVASGSTNIVHPANNAAAGIINQSGKVSSTTGIKKSERESLPVDAANRPSMENSSKSSSSAVCLPSDPVQVPITDLRLAGAVSAIKRETCSNLTSNEKIEVVPAENEKATDVEIGSSFVQELMPSMALIAANTEMSEFSQPSSSSTHSGISGSRPSSGCSSRPQTVFGTQKVGSDREWKPKPTAPGVAQGHGTGDSSDFPTVSVKYRTEEATSELQKKMTELHLPQHPQVIIPNHIHVPEGQRTKLSFGSFDASFGITSNSVSRLHSEKSATSRSETSQGTEEPLDEQNPCGPNAVSTGEDDEREYPELPQSPSNAHKNLPGEEDISISAGQEFNEANRDASFSRGDQYSVVSSPNYNYGFLPQIIGSQLSTLENSESQARDVPRIPSFVIQQPFDPASYYAQFYRSAADNDGRISPVSAPGVATKFNGSAAVFPQQNSQSSQEGGNTVLSSAGSTLMATQAAGLVQNSIAVTQQSVPMFRPPAGLHISPYPPNYIPYGHYFSPFYVPTPGIHQFLSNGAFPQPPQAGMYPVPPASATGVKYQLPQHKSASNGGNSTQIGLPSGYGPYSSSSAGNSVNNEDLTNSQFKENNAYTAGQQSEGLAVYFAGHGRDMASLPPSSFYNLSLQGQHMAFAPSQPGGATFGNIYHPAQAVTAAAVHHPLLQQMQSGGIDMVGAGTGVYQPSQHAQVNWPGNNY